MIEDADNLVKTMFTVAKAHQPSVIFLDEVDNILCDRIFENDGNKRGIKSDFLIHMVTAIILQTIFFFLR